jgi:hypothetical protein
VDPAGGLNALLPVPELLTVREVVDILKISPDSVTNKFQDFPGVIDIGQKASRYGRAYRQLRIPLDGFYAGIAGFIRMFGFHSNLESATCVVSMPSVRPY